MLEALNGKIRNRIAYPGDDKEEGDGGGKKKGFELVWTGGSGGGGKSGKDALPWSGNEQGDGKIVRKQLIWPGREVAGEEEEAVDGQAQDMGPASGEDGGAEDFSGFAGEQAAQAPAPRDRKPRETKGAIRDAILGKIADALSGDGAGLTYFGPPEKTGEPGAVKKFFTGAAAVLFKKVVEHPAHTDAAVTGAKVGGTHGAAGGVAANVLFNSVSKKKKTS